MRKMAISPGLGRAGLETWARGTGPVDFFLIREKTLAAADLLLACREVRAASGLAAGSGGRVLVAGGRVDVALAVGLDGVHVGSGTGELRAGQIRRLFPEAWVSISCHTAEQVQRAREEGASGVLFAPVFGKVMDGVDIVRGVGLRMLEEACRVAGAMPVFALGGITAEKIEACRQAGAAGVAGIRMFTNAEY